MEKLKVTFKKSEYEPRFVGIIYTTKDQPQIYRVCIGKEATDTKPQEWRAEIGGRPYTCH